MLRLHRHYYDDSGSNSSPKQNESDGGGGSGADMNNFQRMDMHPYLTTNNTSDDNRRNNRNNTSGNRRRRYSSHDESNGESSSISSMGRGEPTSLNRRVSGESVQTAPATFATNKPSTNIYQMVQSTTTPEQQRQKPSPSSSRKKRISPTRGGERRNSNTNYQQQQQQYWNSGTASNSGHMSARSQENDGDDRMSLERRRIPSKVVQHDRSNTTIDTAALTNSSRSGSFALHGSSSRSFQVSPTKQDEINQLLGSNNNNNNTIIDTAAMTTSIRSAPLNNSLRSSTSSQQQKRRTSFNSVRSREEDDNLSSKPPPQQQRQTSSGEKSNTMTNDSSGHMSNSSHNNMSNSSHNNITQSSSQDETNVMSNLDEEKYLQEERQRRRQILRGNLDTQEQIQKTKTTSSSLSSYYINQEKSGKKLLLSGGRGRRQDMTEKARRMSGGSEKRMILQEEQQLAYSGRQQQGIEERVVYPGAVHVIPDDDDPAIYPGAVRVGSNRRLMNPYEKDIDNDDNDEDDDEDNKTVQGGSSLSSRHNRRMFQMQQDSIHEDGDENNGSDRRNDMRRIPSSSTMSSLTTTRSAGLMGMNSMSFASRSLRTNSRSSSHHPNNYNRNNDGNNDCNNPNNRYPTTMDMNDINPEISNNARGRKSKLESFRKQWIVLLTLVMVAIGIGLTVGFVSNQKKNDDTTNTNNPKTAGEDIPERWNDDGNNIDENNDESSSSWTSSSFLPWKKVGNDIIMEETLPADGYTQRYTVSMSDDGNIVAIGSPYSDSFQKTDTLFKAGIVRVYAFLGEEEKFQQLGTDLNGYESNDWFGSSVALSADGTTLAVSAKHSSSEGFLAGQVRIFRWNDGEDWIETQIINGDESNSIFGHSLSLSEDGSIIAIGAPYNEGGVSGSDAANNEKSPGRVRIYEYTKKTAEEENDDEYSWIQRGSDIVGETSGEEFGTSVSLSKDGSVLVVGSPKYDQKGKYNDVVEEAGRAYVYHWLDEEYERFDDTIDGNNLRSRGDLLGDTVYISGSILAVGAPTKDNVGYVRTYDVDISTSNSTQEEDNRIRVESSKAITGPKISVQALSNDGLTMGITIDENTKNQVRGDNGENTLGNTVLIYKCNNSTTNDNNQIWTIKGSEEKSIVVNGASIEDNDNTIKKPKIPGYAIAMNHNGNRIVVASWYRCNTNTNDNNKKNNKCTKYPVITVYEWS